MGVETPREDMKKETFWDGVAFDPADPEKYAKSFPIHSMGIGGTDAAAVWRPG